MGFTSGPFLDPVVSHRTIAVSCTAYLANCQILIAPKATEAALLERYESGLHALYVYAIEYWAQYVVAYLKTKRPEHCASFEYMRLCETLQSVDFIHQQGNLDLFLRHVEAAQATGSFIPQGIALSLQEAAQIQPCVEARYKFQALWGHFRLPCLEIDGEYSVEDYSR